MPALLLLLALSLLSLAQTRSQTINDVDFENLPIFHQTQFLSLLTEDRQKRTDVLGDDFFLLSGIRLPEGHTHDFIVREDDTVAPEERATFAYPLIYTGYSSEDLQVLFTLSVPEGSGKEDMKGHIHWNNGELHDVRFSPEHGIHSKLVENRLTSPAHLAAVLPSPLHYFGNRTAPVQKPSRSMKRQTNLGKKLAIRALFNPSFDSVSGGAKNAIAKVLASVSAITSREMGYTLELAATEQVNLPIDLEAVQNRVNNMPYTEDIFSYFVGTAGDENDGTAGMAWVPSACSSGLCTELCGTARSPRSPSNWISWTDDPVFFMAVTAQEIHHNVGFGHTHDDLRLNQDWIDTCGLISPGSSMPAGVGQGTFMSYCQLMRGGSRNLATSFGAVGKFGKNSERTLTFLRNAVQACGRSSGGSGGNTPQSPSPPQSPRPISPSTPQSPRPISPPTPQSPRPISPPTPQSPRPVSPSTPFSPSPPTARPVSPAPASCSDVVLGCPTGLSGQMLCSSLVQMGWCKRTCGACFSSANNAEKLNEEQPITVGSSTCTDKALPGYNCPTLAYDRKFCRSFSSSGLCDSSCHVCNGTVATRNDAVSYTQKTLYDQGEKCTTNKGLPSSTFIAATGRVRAVDSFKVPSGQTWIVSNITIMGYWLGVLPTRPVKFAITIYNRGHPFYTGETVIQPPTVHKGVTFNLKLDQPLVVVGAHLEDSKLVMSEEKYYISIVPTSNNTNHNDEFLWSFSQYPEDPIAQLNAPKKPENFEAKWKDRFSTVSKDCKKWSNPSQCGFTVPSDASGLCFQLKGSEINTVEDHKNLFPISIRPNGGDGEIGSSSGHMALFSDEKMQAVLKERAKLAGHHDLFHAKMADEAVESGSLNDSTPGWAVALLVLFSMFVTVLLVLVIVFANRRRQNETPERV